MRLVETRDNERTGTLRLGVAERSDAARWVPLIQSAYRGDASRQGWTTEADLLEGQRLDLDMALELIDDPHGEILLAEDAAGDLVGSIQIQPEADQVAYVGLFAVAPNHQGRGTGSLLLEWAVAECQNRWNSTQIRMTVLRQRAELISYYERRGFQPTGRFEPFPYGEPRFGLPQVDDLEFVELVRVTVPTTPVVPPQPSPAATKGRPVSAAPPPNRRARRGRA